MLARVTDKAGHLALGVFKVASYKARRALGAAPIAIEQAAASSWDIAPGVDEHCSQIFCPDDHLARITCSSPPGQSLAELRADIRSTHHLGMATQAFLLRDAVLFRQFLHCGLHKGDLYSSVGMRALLQGETLSADRCVIATTYSGARWFGHFMHDELPLQELIPNVGMGVGHLRATFLHEPGWRHLLGVPAPPCYSVVRARELVWIDDRGQNVAKRKRYQTLRSRMHGMATGHERIFLRRTPGSGGDRRIANAEEVEQRLVHEGFVVVDTEQVTVEAMVKMCMGASMVVSLDGSHAAPALYFARDNACLFYIFPPGRVSTIMPRMAGFYGLSGAMFIGEPTDEARDDSVFRVDPSELMRQIDAAAAFTRHRVVID